VSSRTAAPPSTVPARPAIRRALGELQACSARFPITTDRTADDLRAAGWTRADRLSDPSSWPTIARGYADDLGGAALAVGGSCALQEYAGRTAGLVVGAWALTGALLDLTPDDVWLDLRGGRTAGIALPDPEAVTGDGPGHGGAAVPAGTHDLAASAPPEHVAEALLAHLAPAVAASRTVSGLSSRVAWGNVAASVAGIAGALDRAQAPRDRPAWRAAARRILAAPAWPHPGLVVPVVLPFGDEEDVAQSGPADRGGSDAGAAAGDAHQREGALTHERATCCLIRLAPDHESCAACERLDPAERRDRLRAGLRSTAAPRHRLRAVVGAAA
jgi:hypothetical protein